MGLIVSLAPFPRLTRMKEAGRQSTAVLPVVSGLSNFYSCGFDS